MAIANKTTNYGLPLPVGGETMAYQDFINEPMQIIDTQMKANADGVATNTQGLTQANQNISAADTKIANIQDNLNQWNVPGIIQEQESMDSRLTAVEETTMEFVHPEYITITNIDNNPRSISALKSGGLLFVNGLYGKQSEAITITNRYDYSTNTLIPGEQSGVIPLGQIEGNIFNLPSTQNYYVAMVDYQSLHITGTNEFRTVLCDIWLHYDGTTTEFYARPSITGSNFDYVYVNFMIPLGIF